MRESVVEFLDSLGGMPRGLEGVGYGVGDLDALVEGMLVSSKLADCFERREEGRKELERRARADSRRSFSLSLCFSLKNVLSTWLLTLLSRKRKRGGIS